MKHYDKISPYNSNQVSKINTTLIRYISHFSQKMLTIGKKYLQNRPMHKKHLFLLIGIILFGIITCLQTANGQVVYETDYVRIPISQWEKIRDNTMAMKFDCENKDSQIAILDSIVLSLKQTVRLKDSVIALYKQSLNSSETLNELIEPPARKENYLEWEGFYIGVSANYEFKSDNVKFLEGLRYAGVVNARLRIGKYILEPSYSIPLGKDSGSLNLLIGVKLF